MQSVVIAGALLGALPAVSDAQWKSGDRVPPVTAAALDDVIRQWQAELKYRALTPEEQTRADEQAQAARDAVEAKKQAREQCLNDVSPADVMPLQEKMTRRIMELTQAGDQNAATKAYGEMQQAVLAMQAKKCGPEVKDTAGPQFMSVSNDSYKLREWLTAYLAILAEKGPSAAATFVLATPEEVKLIDTRMVVLKQLMASEAKLNQKQ